jgi:hypothetical protein
VLDVLCVEVSRDALYATFTNATYIGIGAMVRIVCGCLHQRKEVEPGSELSESGFSSKSAKT